MSKSIVEPPLSNVPVPHTAPHFCGQAPVPTAISLPLTLPGTEAVLGGRRNSSNRHRISRQFGPHQAGLAEQAKYDGN